MKTKIKMNLKDILSINDEIWYLRKIWETTEGEYSMNILHGSGMVCSAKDTAINRIIRRKLRQQRKGLR